MTSQENGNLTCYPPSESSSQVNRENAKMSETLINLPDLVDLYPGLNSHSHTVGVKSQGPESLTISKRFPILMKLLEPPRHSCLDYFRRDDYEADAIPGAEGTRSSKSALSKRSS